MTLASGAAAQSSSGPAELTRMLNDFLSGIGGENAAAVHDRFWADDLIYTRGSGQRVGKPEIMKSVRSTPAAAPGGRSTSYTAEDVRIQQYGNTAVVAFRLVGTTRDGSSVSTEKFLNTGVFVKRKGEWRVGAWQATKIPDTANSGRQ